MAATEASGEGQPSYHDVIVHVDGQAHKIRDNYAYELTCTRTSGWRLWWTWGGEPKLLGGEFDSGQFRIEVKGVTVCGSPNESERVTQNVPTRCTGAIKSGALAGKPCRKFLGELTAPYRVCCSRCGTWNESETKGAAQDGQ